MKLFHFIAFNISIAQSIDSFQEIKPEPLCGRLKPQLKWSDYPKKGNIGAASAT